MDGIEKITARIDADAQAEIDALNAQTQSEIDAIAASCDAKAKGEAAELLQKSEAAAAQREERLASMAALEARKQVLAAKQAIIDETFDLALEQLCALPREQYVALLADLAVKAARTGREELMFSPEDKARCAAAVVAAANQKLAKAVAPKLPQEVTETKLGAIVDKVIAGVSAIAQGTGLLTVADETRPIRGGFIMVDGEVEVNCAFETLVRLQKGGMTAEVAHALFD